MIRHLFIFFALLNFRFLAGQIIKGRVLDDDGQAPEVELLVILQTDTLLIDSAITTSGHFLLRGPSDFKENLTLRTVNLPQKKLGPCAWDVSPLYFEVVRNISLRSDTTTVLLKCSRVLEEYSSPVIEFKTGENTLDTLSEPMGIQNLERLACIQSLLRSGLYLKITGYASKQVFGSETLATLRTQKVADFLANRFSDPDCIVLHTEVSDETLNEFVTFQFSRLPFVKE
ncbi:MAG: hypothetical protein JNL57_07625 [Bacteroidetes bacterium]|nr:hypothetical protein [Bacteroidota bacterium]